MSKSEAEDPTLGEIRKRIVEATESDVRTDPHSATPVSEYIPYLLVKILDQLEAITGELESFSWFLDQDWYSKNH